MRASPKKLSKIIGKWRKRKKGQFVVYSKDNKKFVIPLCYLNHPIFRVLLEMAEEEYGLMIHGPLRVPCEREFMEYILCLLGNNPEKGVEAAVLSMAKCGGGATAAAASPSGFFPAVQEQGEGAMQVPVSSCG